MGFFSWTCAKTNLPIMNSCSGDNPDEYSVTLLRPGKPPVSGIYDGYGRLFPNTGEDAIDLNNLCYNKQGKFTGDLNGAKLVLTKFWDREPYSEIKGKSNNDPGQGHFHSRVAVKAWYAHKGFRTYKDYLRAFDRVP